MLRCLVTSRGRLALNAGIRICALKPSLRCISRTGPLRCLHSEANTIDATANREGYGRPQGRSKAVHDLAFLVSQRNAKSPSPKLQTPRGIKSFYRAVKEKGLLNELTSDELSSLIRLFGSLSILPSWEGRQTGIQDDDADAFAWHPLARTLYDHQTSGRRTHWRFVLLVAEDKMSRGLGLEESDSYWLMRAALEDVKRLSVEEPEGDNIKLCLDRAKNYYLMIKRPNDAWSVHRIYLTALLDYGGREYCDEVLARLGNLLSWKGGLPAAMRKMLWSIAVFPGADIRRSTKSRFLHILRKKLAEAPDMLSMYLGSSSQATTSIDTMQLKHFDALSIRDYFADLIFAPRPGRHPSLRYLHEIYPWALFEARAALCAFNDGTFATSDEEDDAAWNNLVLLSLSFTSARETPGSVSATGAAPQPGFDGGLDSQSQVLGWTVVCSLAALMSELHLRSPWQKHNDLAVAHGIQEIARTLWILWRKEEAWRAGAVMRSMPIICSATTSFMALASVSGDSRLAISLVRHIADSVIYPAQLGGENLDRDMLRDCAVHFAVLAATWGVGTPPQRSWEGILSALRYAQLIPEDNGSHAVQYLNSIATSTVLHLLRDHSTLAHELIVSAAEHGLSMSDEVISAVGRKLSSEGRLGEALGFLKDGRLSGAAASHLLDTIFDSLSNDYQHKLRCDLAQLFSDVFTEASILPTNNHALETFIQLCMKAGKIEVAVRIVEVVCRSSSTLLRPAFLTQFVTSLISHRHYKLLGKVLKNVWHKIPSRRGSFFRGFRLRYTQQLLSMFPKAKSEEIARSLPFSVYVWPVLKDHIPFHPRLAQLEKKIISLKLSSNLNKAEKLDERTLERAVYLLVSSGRITSAIKLLRKHSPDNISTKAGNIILSASLLSKHKGRRQVRHSAKRLAQFVEERGFVPDRITLNLLMKSLLRWQSLTPTSTIRALFDKLVMNGYPMPENFATEGVGPAGTSALGQPRLQRIASSRTLFGTELTPSAREAIPINLQEFPKHISFRRHTEPLYKMFIKALKGRGDPEGAARIRRVLKEVEAKEERQLAFRNEARRLGRIRAREKRRLATASSKKN